MNIIDLKNKIKEQNLDDTLLILQCEENDFIAKEYINEISRFKNLSIYYLKNLEEYFNISSDTLFSISNDMLDDNLYIYQTDKYLYSDKTRYEKCANVIIICHKVEDEENQLKKYIVKIPKLLDWQVLDYMKSRCEGIDEECLKWLQINTNNNIYKIDNELSKLDIFTTSLQKHIFNLINSEDGYCDISNSTIFSLTNAITKNDMKALKETLLDINNIDVEAMTLISVLRKNLKNILNIQMNPTIKCEELKLTPKQFTALRYSCNKYSNNELIRMYSFIITLDEKIKGGKLQLTNDRLVDYIVCKLITQ